MKSLVRCVACGHEWITQYRRNYVCPECHTKLKRVQCYESLLLRR